MSEKEKTQEKEDRSIFARWGPASDAESISVDDLSSENKEDSGEEQKS